MNVFDIIGPVMIGPSSSHTAGAVRLGRVAWKVLGEIPQKADIALAGSFAMTGMGHGTDKALMAGCLGMHSYDDEIRSSLAIAEEKGIEYNFSKVSLPDAHPNTAVIRLSGKNGKECVVEGASIGGGNISISRVNGMEVSFTGQSDTYLIQHTDQAGCIAAVTNVLAGSEINIANFRLSRKKKGGEALMMIEIDGRAPRTLLEPLKKISGVTNVILIRAV